MCFWLLMTNIHQEMNKNVGGMEHINMESLAYCKWTKWENILKNKGWLGNVVLVTFFKCCKNKCGVKIL